jgi:peptide/nickel transport system permease protein
MSKRRIFQLAVILLSLLYAAVLLAGFVAPYDPAEQDREYPFVPPTRLHFIDAQGTLHAWPFIYASTSSPDNFAEYHEDHARVFPLRFFVVGENYSLLGFVTCHRHLFGVDQPGRIFLLGTDGYGRDQFSRLLWGGRISLLAGLIAATLSLFLGMLVGAASGYFGGFVDDVLMRLVELFLAVPWLYLLFAVRAFLPLHISPTGAFLLVVAVIGIVGWARPARLIRGVVLGAKERKYVLAARGFGASDFYLLRRHILPQTMGVFLTQAALLIPQYILAEVTLSFLGLGVGEPVPSWGNMLGSLQQYHILASYWWMLVPGLVLVPVFWGYHVLADFLHEPVEFRH